MQKIYQLKVELKWIEPSIWRRIQVPGDFTFWDLHVAIQDTMGWKDKHLHQYSLTPINRKCINIGITEIPDTKDPDILSSWQERIDLNFYGIGDTCEYLYDFGDQWMHRITLEEILEVEDLTGYPKCIAGERACPPEDSHGPAGYRHLVELVKKKTGYQYKAMKEWLGGEYDPEVFNLDQVTFDDPLLRLKRVLTSHREDKL
jgi:hypothetical protein